MKLVVVESPAKAKTINKYLGSDYTVLASYGHVSDLPAKDGSVRPDEDFAMSWETDPRSEKHLKDITAALRTADRLILATDPDREGEAISWHVRRVLQERKALKSIPVERVVFNEITKSAILEAMAHPRALDDELVDAYLARRALDYLVGFTLSPVLWRKLPGSRSAGRVQSVALRLICEREAEIEKFKNQEYWSVDGDFATVRNDPFSSHLIRLDGVKLDRLDIKSEAAARDAEAKLRAASFHIGSVEKKEARRNPFPPFTTSTLQQEASRKLGFAASHTMRIAQRLYEGVDIGGETVGLITYMRTDGVQMAGEAIEATRSLIGNIYGDRYVPKAPRIYKTKAKNAQEAHEAIRPTDLFRRPEDLGGTLDRDQKRLYELIWKRTVASQMESAVLDQVVADIVSADDKLALRATGSVVRFDGFLTLYREDRDDSEDDEGDRRLPQMAAGETVSLKDVRPAQHFTQPPPRYGEASLVKRMEELGIGRPSTYASIITVLQDRDYVRLENRRFIPEDRGRLVTAFLESFFNRYVQYDFTADLEEELDDISGGRVDWKTVLRKFWAEFSTSVEGTKDLRVGQVLDALDKDLGPHFFPEDGSGRDPRLCPTCKAGRLSLKLGRFGAFIGCANYPECKYTRPLVVASEDGTAEAMAEGPKNFGNDPVTGLPVTLRKGPYGVYVQLGEAETGSKVKPKRTSLPKGMEAGSLTLERALALLSLPREVGVHPETGNVITAGLGRFGPYLKHGDIFVSIPRGDDVLSIGLNRTMDLLAADAAKGRKPPQNLGEHPGDKKPILLRFNRFGAYLSHGKTMASLPKGKTEVTLEEAVALLAAKSGKSVGPAKRAADAKAKAASTTEGKAPAAKKAAKPKTATKKASAKKAAPKKTAAAKATG